MNTIWIAEDNLLGTLTDREAEIVTLLYKGLSYREVADTLVVEDCTVKTHINNIFKKLKVNRLQTLLVYVREHGRSI